MAAHEGGHAIFSFVDLYLISNRTEYERNFPYRTFVNETRDMKNLMESGGGEGKLRYFQWKQIHGIQ